MNELNITAANVINTSSANVNVKLGKLSACGIELENIELNTNVIVTDEHTKVECDMITKLFGQLIVKFGDHITGLLDAEADNVRARKARIEAEVETEQKRAEQYAAETAYYNARTEKIKGENNDGE